MRTICSSVGNQEQPLKLPARISKYELQKYLGGGMSEVYQARDTVLGRTVAVKLLTQQASANHDTRARFLLEARVSSVIQHENIITAYDYGEQDGMPFLVLEFLTGRTLKELIASGEDLLLRRRVSIAIQLARALAHVHTLNMIHRDVKPDNVHVDAQFRVKLMDFGIVKTGEVTLTQAGYALGTPHYVAPEVIMGRPVTPQNDVYSFGVVLFELLTGQRAIQAESAEQIFYRILHDDIPFAPMAEKQVPEELQQIVRSATARDPRDRTPVMADVALQLEAWLEAQPTQERSVCATAAPPIRRQRVPNRWIAASAAVALLLATGVAYFLLSAQQAVARIDDDLGEMAFVSDGPFRHGPDKTPLTLSGFYIDVTEVRNEDYEQFCQATGRPLPPGFERGKPGYPVVNVTIDDARAFAAWAGKRLPTEKEWQKAARGADGRSYPWGDTPSPSHANVADNPDDSWQHRVSVDAYRAGRSPFEVLQMIGNVREFTADRGTPDIAAIRKYQSMLDPSPTATDPWVVVKGGSYLDKLAETSIPMIEIVPARYRAPDLGFRCVKDR